MTEQQARDIIAGQQRIERILEALLAALADDDEEPQRRTLEGETLPRERDQTKSLG